MATRDETLVERCEPLYRSHGLTVLHPAELINHLDSVEREGDYRPARIEGSKLKNQLLRAEKLDAVVLAFKTPNERAGDFKKTLLHCLSKPKNTEVQVITDQANAPVLLGVIERDRSEALSIPVLRHGSNPMAGTMLRNYLRACLTSAAGESRCVVKISQSPLSELTCDILKEFGFISCGDIWGRITLRAVGTLNQICDAALGLCLDPALELARSSALNAIRAALAFREINAIAAIERQLWPAKVVESEVPVFIVSIRPSWAQHFFDSDLGSLLLFGLRDDLHLGVEGVYYRSAKNNNMIAPGRVLWYVSQGDGDGSMAIKACSHLEEILVGKPKELFRRFQRLGVYEWRDVFAAAENDVSKDIVAFRFRMTERFQKPVDKSMLESFGVHFPILSPRKISDSQFASIYRTGCGLT